ncbi:hypothetical protein N7931_05340 [Catenovulum sp. 2E275]|uniref:hypothetical protein n=1 Tax=Catenovulum sp. 2E275 TaxID=2980497 RepID=UPI0021CEB64F|nr:hypothetical protein [Catenovulum sp. 2E275]MCU4675053.1 hypothetical protein [Catenovulum sp. 2E275]
MVAIIKQLAAKYRTSNTTKYTASLMLSSVGFYLLVYQKGHKKPVYASQHILQDKHNWQLELNQLLQNEFLKQSTLNIILPHEHYQLLVVDRPEVNEEELAQAIRYSAKDYLNTTLEEVAIDYFDIPIQIFGQNKVNLVAARLKFLQPLIKVCLENCQKIHRITVSELAYQDLFAGDQDASMLIIHQPNEELLIQIVKNGQLYFFRRIRGYSKLNEYTEFEINQGAVDSLSIEIQRSLDYFESQLRQASVKRIYISVNSHLESVLIDKIGENFTMPVLPLKNRVADLLPEKTENDHGYYPAVGAAQELIREQ